MSTTDGGSAEADVVLVALGRKPATDDLGVEIVGLEPGKTIDVDSHMRVPGHEWLYAIGDINGRALFTHMGKYQARVAADFLLGHDRALSHGADGPLSPRVIFTEPQVAAVGHTTESAEKAGLIVDVYETSTSGNAGGSFYGRNAPGTTRWLVDRERRIVVGCTITGAEIADFLHAATIAIVGEVPLERLRHAVPSVPHPQRGLAAAGATDVAEVGLRGRRAKRNRRGGSRLRSLPEPGASADLAGAAGLSPQASLFASLTSASKKTLFPAGSVAQEGAGRGSRNLRNFDLRRTFGTMIIELQARRSRMSPLLLLPPPSAPSRRSGASSCSRVRPDGDTPSVSSGAFVRQSEPIPGPP